LLAIEVVVTHAAPIILIHTRLSFHHVAFKVDGTWQEEGIAAVEQARPLRGRRARLEIVGDIVEVIELAISGRLAPIVDGVIPEVAVESALKADIAAEIVDKQIVMPGDASASRERGVTVACEIEALAQDAPLNGDTVGGERRGDDFAGAPTE
jgi:hypothetical protein